MHLKAKLSQGDAVYGLFCSVPAALSIELIAAAGYDFAIIDLEHTLIGSEQLASMLLAARASGLAALVRIAAGHQAVQALDAGAQGVVFPRVRTADAAQQAARLCRFAPHGERGLNATWLSRYGRDDLHAAMRISHEQTLVVAMIEDTEGVEQVDAIATVPGIDVLLEGAADLSQSLGVAWQTRHPDVLTAVLRIDAAARRHGKTFCALPRAVEDVDAWHRKECRMFVLGDDRGIARRAFAAHLAQHRSQPQR